MEQSIVDGDAIGFTGINWPEWASDGRVYFVAADREGTHGLWAIPAPGGSPRLVVHFDDPTRPGGWWGITVGNGTIYLSLPEFESDIYAMDLEY